MTTVLVLLLGAMAAALTYSFMLARPPSAVRTVIKTLAVGLLAIAAWRSWLPVPLIIGLALSAVGDAFLAGDPKRWLPYGLASFLAAHVAYIVFFIPMHVAGFPPARGAGMAVTVIAGLGMLAWLWPTLGALRLPVIAYVAAIIIMVCASFMLPTVMWRAMIGAVLFFASDAILSAQLFRQRFTGRAGALSVWWLYWFGQAFFIYAALNEALGRIAI